MSSLVRRLTALEEIAAQVRRREIGDLRKAECRECAVHPAEISARGIIGGRFGHQQQRQRDQRRSDGGAEQEYRTPVIMHEQPTLRDEPADHGSERIAGDIGRRGNAA